ncbi:MAG: putative peptidase [Firmicutes bacterium]|nr:putative peptidase [Bacillota bacterium]
MPGKLWPFFLYLKKCSKSKFVLRWLSVWVAVVFLIVAAVLASVLSSNGGLYTKKMPEPKLTRYESATPLAVLKQEESPPNISTNEPLPDKKVEPHTVGVDGDLPKPVSLSKRPLTGEVILGYGWQQRPVFNDWRFHTGIDIKAEIGSLVVSATDGKVVVVKQDNYYGWMVIVETKGTTLCYASLGEVAVRGQQELVAGTKIGTVGTSSGEPYPHLHFSSKEGNSYINVADLLDRIK